MPNYSGYFSGCGSVEDVRRLYFELAKKHHPDVGGSLEVMQEINRQYADACGGHARKSYPGMGQSHYDAMKGVDELLRRIIVELVKIQGIKVEICGKWIWVSGNTFAHKDQLRSLGLKWASKKQMWFYAGVPAHSRKPMSIQRIRSVHGSRVISEDDIRS